MNVVDSNGFMAVNFIRKVSELVNFMGLRNHSHDDVLRYLAYESLIVLECTCICISDLSKNGTIEVSGLFGFNRSEFQAFPSEVRLQDPYPVPEVLRLRRTVWINTLPKWPKEYSMMKPIPLPNNERTVINFPIDRFGSPVACMSIFSTLKLEPNAEIEAFLRAVGSVYALYKFKDDLEERIKLAAESIIQSKRRPTQEYSSGELTERQKIILRLMSEKKTNLEISELIGYSESTVRQETIRIFATIGVANRHDAAEWYLRSQEEDKGFAS